jgi:GMP synthase (glutamine-hydrolysing)
LQFHPEVFHSTEGQKVIQNFLYHVAGIAPNWTPASFVKSTIEELKEKIGVQKVLLGLSGE